MASLATLFLAAGAAAAGARCSAMAGGGSDRSPQVVAETIPDIDYAVRTRYPHDPDSFTEGLVYFRGGLYESTGLHGHSAVRHLDIETGRTDRLTRLPETLFGEGLTAWDDRLIQLTWKAGVALIYAATDLHETGRFHYAGEGWGATRLDGRLVISDGSSDLRLVDPEGREPAAVMRVTVSGRRMPGLNELEAVDGVIFANVYPTDCVARIDPETGAVNGWIDLSGLLPWSERPDGAAVANGIAYDSESGDLFVTGKRWPFVYRIRILGE